MKNDINAALNYLNRDYLINASIIEPIKNDTVEVLYASDRGIFVKDKVSGVYMLQTEDFDLADKLIASLSDDAELVVHSTELVECASKYGFGFSVPCYQAVYQGGKFDLPDSELHIRIMQEDEAEIASQLYRWFDLESAKQHIELGFVYGGYIGDETIAMIGMHLQGAMGMLEVKEKFRRRGYAELMEKYLINSLLDKGLTPYCQIIEDNTASLLLQRKLGLDISTNKLYWLHKERVLCG